MDRPETSVNASEIAYNGRSRVRACIGMDMDGKCVRTRFCASGGISIDFELNRGGQKRSNVRFDISVKSHNKNTSTTSTTSKQKKKTVRFSNHTVFPKERRSIDYFASSDFKNATASKPDGDLPEPASIFARRSARS